MPVSNYNFGIRGIMTEMDGLDIQPAPSGLSADEKVAYERLEANRIFPRSSLLADGSSQTDLAIPFWYTNCDLEEIREQLQHGGLAWSDFGFFPHLTHHASRITSHECPDWTFPRQAPKVPAWL